MITEQIGSYHLFAQGFRKAKVTDSEEKLQELRRMFKGVELQLLRADRVAGREHLVFAARNAVDSFGSKGRRAKHLAMEFLLFASGEHQILEAIKLLGVTPATPQLAVAGLSVTEFDSDIMPRRLLGAIGGVPDDTVLDVGGHSKMEELKQAYHISEKEFDASRMPGESEESVLKRLVIERSALLVLEN